MKFVEYLLHKSIGEFFVFPAFSRKLTARWVSKGKYPLIFFSTEGSKICMKKLINIITSLPTLLFDHDRRHRWAVFVSWYPGEEWGWMVVTVVVLWNALHAVKSQYSVFFAVNSNKLFFLSCTFSYNSECNFFFIISFILFKLSVFFLHRKLATREICFISEVS